MREQGKSERGMRWKGNEGNDGREMDTRKKGWVIDAHISAQVCGNDFLRRVSHFGTFQENRGWEKQNVTSWERRREDSLLFSIFLLFPPQKVNIEWLDKRRKEEKRKRIEKKGKNEKRTDRSSILSSLLSNWKEEGKDQNMKKVERKKGRNLRRGKQRWKRKWKRRRKIGKCERLSFGERGKGKEKNVVVIYFSRPILYGEGEASDFGCKTTIQVRSDRHHHHHFFPFPRWKRYWWVSLVDQGKRERRERRFMSRVLHAMSRRSRGESERKKGKKRKDFCSRCCWSPSLVLDEESCERW